MTVKVRWVPIVILSPSVIAATFGSGIVLEGSSNQALLIKILRFGQGVLYCMLS